MEYVIIMHLIEEICKYYASAWRNLWLLYIWSTIFATIMHLIGEICDFSAPDIQNLQFFRYKQRKYATFS